MSRHKILSCALLTLALGACDLPATTPITIVDGPFAGSGIYGVVRTADGAPAAGVAVRLEARVAGACTPAMDIDSVVTDSLGRYRGYLGLWGDPFDACLRVWATPATGASFGPDSATRPLVRIGDEPRDSIKVDFTLPPRS